MASSSKLITSTYHRMRALRGGSVLDVLTRSVLCDNATYTSLDPEIAGYTVPDSKDIILLIRVPIILP